MQWLLVTISAVNNFKTLDRILREQSAGADEVADSFIYDYARAMAAVEGAVVVVSDLLHNTSRIFCGQFGRRLGLENYSSETSIWEKEILSRMSSEECDRKYLAELRFFHYLSHLPRRQRSARYLITNLSMADANGLPVDVTHRMYYIYASDGITIRYALCVYVAAVFRFAAQSIVVDSNTGNIEELTSCSDSRILGVRQTQVLSLIERGHTSAEIAELLSISRHTVSRHRQEILAKLQVKNSIEACRRAKAMGII